VHNSIKLYFLEAPNLFENLNPVFALFPHRLASLGSNFCTSYCVSHVLCTNYTPLTSAVTFCSASEPNLAAAKDWIELYVSCVPYINEAQPGYGQLPVTPEEHFKIEIMGARTSDGRWPGRANFVLC
jgi:hypothetical protein